jgi:hypothetical protein
MTLLTRLDKDLLRSSTTGERERQSAPEGMPLEGRKLHVHVDWPGPVDFTKIRL